MQPYDFQVVHIPGPQKTADPLSCLLDSKIKPDEHKHEAEEYVRFVAVNATLRALSTSLVEEVATDNEEQRSKVRHAIKTGRSVSCRAYMPIASELLFLDYLVLHATHIVEGSGLSTQA